jgi:hypothetical protein
LRHQGQRGAIRQVTGSRSVASPDGTLQRAHRRRVNAQQGRPHRLTLEEGGQAGGPVPLTTISAQGTVSDDSSRKGDRAKKSRMPGVSGAQVDHCVCGASSILRMPEANDTRLRVENSTRTLG